MIKEVRVIKGKQLQEIGMNCFYGVGQAAIEEPRCVIVHYQGNPECADTDIAFIGKGIVFDSGGLNLKMQMIEMMYGDKGGACAVFGALHGVLKLKPKKNIIFAGAFADNACDANSYKPGDIITSLKGLTVEIGNTDAEGRLVLCDTMTYVQREFKPKKMIDLCTLTGSCIVALGQTTGGLFTNDDEFANQIMASSARSFEPMWRMPINDEHREAMTCTPYADLNNLGASRWGGACTAAAFLEFFVEKDVKWCHMDIAGPVLQSGAKAPICNGGSGFASHLLLDYLMHN